MVVINRAMNMSEKLIFLGQGLKNIGSLTGVGPVEIINPELMNTLAELMSSIEEMAAESFEENIVQVIRVINEEVRMILQRSSSIIVNNVIDLYSRVI